MLISKSKSKLIFRSRLLVQLVPESHTLLLNVQVKDTETIMILQGGSNMSGTDLCVNKPHCAAAVRP